MKIKHSLMFAMIDGKVCNAVTNTTSTQMCYICGASCKDFNDIAKMLTRPIKTEHLEFGISDLHGWIRVSATRVRFLLFSLLFRLGVLGFWL